MNVERVIAVLRAFGESRRSCGKCPHFNDCGRIGCRLADEAAALLERALEDLQVTDVCEICAWGQTVPDECECECESCQAPCRCAGCVKESEWKWRGCAG